MSMTDERKEYIYQYAKEKLKRIPLDVPKATYEEIKAHAQAHGESVNGFIKRAIAETIEAAKNPFILDEKTTHIIHGEEYGIYYRKRFINRSISETIARDQAASGGAEGVKDDIE